MEATGTIQYALPLMISLLISRFVGDLLSKGLYCELAAVMNFPLLEKDSSDIFGANSAVVIDYMTPDVELLSVDASVGRLLEVLNTTTHSMFPVVDGSTSSILVGSLSRSSLIQVLMNILKKLRDRSTASSDVDYIAWEDISSMISSDYNKNTIEHLEVQFTGQDKQLQAGLQDFMDKSPFIILQTASLSRAYSMFRSLGLRHLIVIDDKMKVTGILTRANFSTLSEIGYVERKLSMSNKLGSYNPLKL